MNPVLALLFVAAVGYLATLIAYRRGLETGRDQGWIQHWEEVEAENKARRDERGRYRSLRDQRQTKKPDEQGGSLAI